MQNLINNPALDQYLETYNEGGAVFLEGDASKDLFILVTGSLKLLKNKKQIGEIYRSGELVGEMSYLLDTKRSASVVAQTKTKLIRIPEEQIPDFIRDYPDVSERIIHTLAQRLKDTTQVAHGLKEFCDQLPDAVVMTDTQNKIMAWNKAAETLHGRVWQEMKGQSISDVFKNPEEYRQFIEDVQTGRHLTEKILLVKHPHGDKRYVSTSTTVIYDGHFNIAGYIFLSRNVTRLKKLEDNYRKLKSIFIPSFLVITLLLVFISTGLSNYSAGVKILNHKKESFQGRIGQDRHALAEKIKTLPKTPHQEELKHILSQYFQQSQPQQFGIAGVLFLNNEKEVKGAYSPDKDQNQTKLIGTNYSGIPFSGPRKNICKVLSLYRPAPQSPMGTHNTELACQLDGQNGWIIFQLKMGYLQQEFGITGKTLKKLDFP